MKKKRLPAYTPPPSEMFLKTVQEEAEAIARGDTAGLDPAKTYLALRVGRTALIPEWVVAESPVDIERVDGVVLFVANISLAQAVYMVRNGAEVL